MKFRSSIIIGLVSLALLFSATVEGTKYYATTGWKRDNSNTADTGRNIMRRLAGSETIQILPIRFTL